MISSSGKPLPGGVAKTLLTLTVNGECRDLVAAVHKTLLEVLREDLGLTGTKHGCELGECGTCTVLVDGEPVLSCLALPVELRGPPPSTTVEGMARGRRAASAPAGLRRAGRRPVRLLHARHPPDRAGPAGGDARARRASEIREALAGNLCRCTGYTKILDAVELARSAHARARRSERTSRS